MSNVGNITCMLVGTHIRCGCCCVRLLFSRLCSAGWLADWLANQDNSTTNWYRDVKHNVVGSGRKGKFKQSKLVQIGIYIW